MSDITKCIDKKCPSRMKCYRYTAKPSKFGQSYADFNRGEDDNECLDGFWLDLNAVLPEDDHGET